MFMKKKEDLRIVKTKASLYRGLMELMKEKTFEEIKVSEICSVSLINRSTFYDHFNDKYELLQAFIGDLKEGLLRSMVIDKKTKSIKEYYTELLKLLLDHISKNLDVYSAVSKINSNSIARDMMTDAIVSSATKEIDESFINNSEVPTKFFVLFYASGFINVILAALRETDTFDKDKLYYILYTIINNSDLIQ